MSASNKNLPTGITKIAQKRAMIDFKNYLEGTLKEQEHIYIVQNENNILNFKAMILGPDDTPYAGGYYFFDINLSKNHPIKHPSATFYTHGEGMRFHPNLYQTGKVCLSILGTWQGEPWIAKMSIETVLLNIRSIMNDNPIINEPGHENEKKDSPVPAAYIEQINYQNINVAVCDMLTNPPKGFEIFTQDMLVLFRRNYNRFIKYVDDNMDIEGKILKYQGFGGNSCKANMKKLKTKLETIFNNNIKLFNELAIKEAEEEAKRKDKENDSDSDSDSY